MSLLVVPSPTLVFSSDEASLSLHNLTAAARVDARRRIELLF